MRPNEFVYTIYLSAKPQQVWDTITENDGPRDWWSDTHMLSTFKSGSTIVFRRADNDDVQGEILESEAPHKLVHTFRVGGHGPMHDEGVSLVTFEITTNGPSTMLTVKHQGFPDDSAVLKGIAKGWPAILSSMKSFIETGKALRYADWGDRIEQSRTQVDAPSEAEKESNFTII